MFLVSTADTIADWRRWRLRFLFLDERMCCLYPLLRLILPLPVTRNLFAAALLVLIFGTCDSSDFDPTQHDRHHALGVNNIAIFRPSKRGSISTLAMSCT